MRWLVPAAGAGVVGWTAPALAPLIPALCDGLQISRRLAPGEEAVALTFDDGPHPQGTPAVLEVLAGAGARATFFMVGEQVERYPEVAREVVAAGHAVALHGHRHRNLLRLGPGAVAADLERGAGALGDCTGLAPTLYRPPYGIFTPAGLAVVRRRGLAPWLWSRWGRDWRRRATPDAIAGKATEGLCAGDVLLLHDADFYSAQGSWRRTVDALPAILRRVAERGLHPVALPAA
jgi:peptidoglycan/xylan/chitin deacetylase (PgdA/CDA1 family)